MSNESADQSAKEETAKAAQPKAIAPVVKITEAGLFDFNDHNELNLAASMALQLSIVPTKLIKDLTAEEARKAAGAALMMCKQFNLPMKAMNEMGWIEGCLTVYGSLVWALAERHPEYGEHEMFWLDENQDKICAQNKNLKSKVWAAVLRIKKKNSSVWNEYSFTLDEAETAKLYPPMKNEWVNKQKTGKKIINEDSPWFKYIKDMLMHKCKKRGLDANYSSALNGIVYHEDAYEYLSNSRDVTPDNPEAANELHNEFLNDQKDKAGA